MKNKKDYKVIIFDFDGTLVDSVPGIHKTVNIMAKKYKMPSISIEKVKNAIGAGLSKFLEDIFKEVLKNYTLEYIKNDYIKLYKKNYNYKMKTYKGVKKVLKRLFKAKKVLIILSNKLKYFIVKSCKYLSINKYFKEIIGRGELKEDKPSPYPIKYIIQKYKIKKSDVLMVGDSQYDAECAYYARIDFFYISYGYGNKNKTLKFKPTYIEKNIENILKVIKL